MTGPARFPASFQSALQESQVCFERTHPHFGDTPMRLCREKVVRNFGASLEPQPSGASNCCFERQPKVRWQQVTGSPASTGRSI